MRKSTFMGLLLLVFCLTCRFVSSVADFYAVHCYPSISMALSWVGAALPFTLEEIVVLGFVVVLAWILVKAVRKKEGFLHWLGRTAVVLMWCYVWFYMGWGNNYYRTGLYARNGIQLVSYEPDTFRLFLDDFTRELNDAAVRMDAYDPEALEGEVKAFYSEKVTSYGYTALRRWQHVRKPLLNPVFSSVGVLGYMGPFFCESQVNRDLLPCEYPFTVAHEMGHLSGVTSEAEANYWGFACCRASENAAIRYSGYLSVLPYVLSNAAGLLPEAEFNDWAATLCETSKKDYAESREYWRGKQVLWISRFQDWFYNLYLKSNGISEGRKDYSGVVAMIMTMDGEKYSSAR